MEWFLLLFLVPSYEYECSIAVDGPVRKSVLTRTMVTQTNSTQRQGRGKHGSRHSSFEGVERYCCHVAHSIPNFLINLTSSGGDSQSKLMFKDYNNDLPSEEINKSRTEF